MKFAVRTIRRMVCSLILLFQDVAPSSVILRFRIYRYDFSVSVRDGLLILADFFIEPQETRWVSLTSTGQAN